MNLIVDGKPAFIKSGSSFEFIAENRLFMGRDSYTLTLTFPLRDCPQNRAIFANLERMDISKDKLFYDCIIQSKSFSTVGSLLVTGVSETEIKCQFTEGRCEQTATNPFEETYINSLDLGEQPSEGYFTPREAWGSIDSGRSEVALPWINEAYPLEFNNGVTYSDNGYLWAKSVSDGSASRYNPGASGTHRPTTSPEPSESMSARWLSWQPYLIVIAKRICDAVGYTYNFDDWEASDYRHLIICNTLPSSWDNDNLRDYNQMLPKWTVSEFFEKLELLLMCEFNINHKTKHIDFQFTKAALKKIEPVELDNVTYTYSADITTDNNSCSYLGVKRLAYKECDHSMQPYYACDWFVADTYSSKYDTLAQLVESNKKRYLTASDGRKYPAYGKNASLWEMDGGAMIYDNVHMLLYARDVDTYFVFRSIGTEAVDGYRPGGYAQIYVLQPVNVFGSGCIESDDVDNEEIEFVPVCVSDTYVSADDDHGYMMYLSFSSYQDEKSTELSTEPNAIMQPMTSSKIEDGEKEEKSEYYNVIYVGFWDGTVPNEGKTPYPMIDTVNVTQDYTFFSNHLPDLRLSSGARNIQSQLPAIDPKQKFKFSFISDTIPNPRAVFYIRGKRYVCEKITATFTENGMSQLLKGEFYPII